ncbi:MAG: CoA transferase, partial [Alphaproteobacteria bacterium]|nr:CoA transferase [Alphaproteobacteria bacterium]
LEDALASLEEAGVPAAEARSGASEVFLDDGTAQENGLVTEARHPTAGRMRIAWNYIGFRDTAPSAARPTPLLGEHSADVLAEAGADAGEIEALFASGAVLAETG